MERFVSLTFAVASLSITEVSTLGMQACDDLPEEMTGALRTATDCLC